jgi:hypothetical protein
MSISKLELLYFKQQEASVEEPWSEVCPGLKTEDTMGKITKAKEAGGELKW